MPDSDTAVVELDTAGALIKWARQQAGLLQTELAAQMGVSYQQVGRWENHENSPSADKFFEACALCGFDVVLEPMVDE